MVRPCYNNGLLGLTARMKSNERKHSVNAVENRHKDQKGPVANEDIQTIHHEPARIGRFADTVEHVEDGGRCHYGQGHYGNEELPRLVSSSRQIGISGVHLTSKYGYSGWMVHQGTPY